MWLALAVMPAAGHGRARSCLSSSRERRPLCHRTPRIRTVFCRAHRSGGRWAYGLEKRRAHGLPMSSGAPNAQVVDETDHR